MQFSRFLYGIQCEEKCFFITSVSVAGRRQRIWEHKVIYVNDIWDLLEPDEISTFCIFIHNWNIVWNKMDLNTQSFLPTSKSPKDGKHMKRCFSFVNFLVDRVFGLITWTNNPTQKLVKDWAILGKKNMTDWELPLHYPEDRLEFKNYYVIKWRV